MATVPPARARRKLVCILTEVLASIGVPVPYKDGANGERIIDAVLLLQTAEMGVGIEHNSSIRYLDRVINVADELGVEVYESAPAPSPAAPSAAAAPDAAFLESAAATARDKIKEQHAYRGRGLLQTPGDRLFFGRNNPEQALKGHETAMNAAS